MKCRNDFVTNSSSSSFILAFKDEEKACPWGTSWESFRECCDWNDYDEFFNLIKNLKKDSENTDKEKALEQLRNYYIWEKKWELIDTHFNGKYANYEKQKEYENTEEFKEAIRIFLETNEEYLEKKKQIEEADLTVMGMIWDTNGGLLEWSIRNGFIQDEFRRNSVMVWNVG